MKKTKFEILKTLQFFIILLTASILISCNTEKEKKNTVKKTYSGDAKIEFYNTHYDFGTLIEGEIVECIFKYKNIGDAPLKMLSVTADCGCTVPEFNQKKLLPGEEDKIKVVFNSSGFRNNIYKTIDVETNTTEKYFELVLTAYIENNKSLN